MPAATFKLPLAAATVWCHRVQLAGALVLGLSPFLPWVQFPLLKMTVFLPGILLSGVLVLVLSLLAAAVAGWRLRQPGWQLLIAGASAFVVYRQIRSILHGTDYALNRLQLSLVDLNEALLKVGLSRIEVVPTGWPPHNYLGPGLWVALSGALLLAVGAVLEATVEARSKSLASVLLGWPRCLHCDHRVSWNMAFCPGCGRSQVRGKMCPSCRGWLAEDFAYCPACGAAAKQT